MSDNKPDNRECEQSPTDASEILRRIENVREVGGGSMSRAFRGQLRLPDGGHSHVFVKTNQPEFIDNFCCESDGLAALGLASGPIPQIVVPQPIAVGVVDDRAVLILPWLEPHPVADDDRFAEAIATLHRRTLGESIGWHIDNFIGSTRQFNGEHHRWPEFFCQRRLEPQLRFAVDAGNVSSELRRDMDSLIASMDQHWPNSQTCLNHGDLWSGNFFASRVRAANTAAQWALATALIDPAVCRCPPEMDLGMIRLFGGVGPNFWRRYRTTNPLSGGWSHRVDLAMLYHLLNHLNLFGVGYLNRCETLASELLRGPTPDCD